MAKGKVFGQKIIDDNLAKAIKGIEGDISKGLNLGLAEVQSDATLNAPIEFGPLRASSFHDVDRRGPKVKGRVGFVAEYAPYVHEAPMTLEGQPRASGKGVYWQGGANKFLERAIKEGGARLVSTIKRFAKR